jgi:hypothetical protein
MPIKNLSNLRRLPRLGKISLGIKAVAESGKEYPKEVDFFVCPEKVQKIYGEKPKELRIMFPVENGEVFFQQWLKSYGYNLLKCKGDGEKAYTWDEKEGGLKEIPCPCEKLEKSECRRVGILQFLLPDVDGAGVWQISTSSKNSIIDINSSIDYIRALCGRIRMIPLILKREEMKTQRIENGKPKSGKHYTLKIDVENISVRQLQQYGQTLPEQILLPPPDEAKDELFFPANGFKPETETEDAEKEKPKEDIMPYKTELNFLTKKYQQLGTSLTSQEGERLNALLDDDVEGYKKAIEYFKIRIEAIEKKKPQKELFKGKS